MNCVLLVVGVLVPSNRRFAFACFGVWCFPNVPEWILLLLFTLSAFPLTSSDRARLQPRLGYFYFCRFLLLWGGSNSNWTSASGLAKDRQVRARATDGERKSGRTRNNPRIKGSGFPSMTVFSSPLSSPRLRACFCSLSAPLLACELSCLLDVINGPALCRVARFGFTPQSLEVSCAPLWWADEESAGAHGRDEGVHFFHRSALDCLVFPALVIKGHWLSEIFLLTLYFHHFFLSLIPSCTGLVQGHLKETLFAGFIGDRRLSRRVWLFESSLCVCWQGCVVQEKGGARCQMFAWPTPSRKYQKALYEVL